MSEQGPKAETEAERLGRLVEVEAKKLAELGFPIENWNFPQFENQCRLNAVEKILMDKGLITQEEALPLVRQIALDELTAMRQQVETQLAEQRKQQLFVPSRDQVIYGANGRPL